MPVKGRLIFSYIRLQTLAGAHLQHGLQLLPLCWYHLQLQIWAELCDFADIVNIHGTTLEDIASPVPIPSLLGQGMETKIIEPWKCWMWYLTKEIESTKNGISYHLCQCRYLLGNLFVIFTWWGRKRKIELELEEIFERKQAFFLLSLYVVHLDASVWILPWWFGC